MARHFMESGPGIRAKLLGVEGVTAATVEVDPKGFVDAIVTGGRDQDVFDALLGSVPAGVGARGEIQGFARDSQGTQHAMAFSRPEGHSVPSGPQFASSSTSGSRAESEHTPAGSGALPGNMGSLQSTLGAFIVDAQGSQGDGKALPADFGAPDRADSSLSSSRPAEGAANVTAVAPAATPPPAGQPAVTGSVDATLAGVTVSAQGTAGFTVSAQGIARGTSTAFGVSSGPAPPPARPSSAWLSRKTHEDEHSLRVGEYAQALASLMEAADDEFCFAIYGHWGRGKTFFAQQLQEKLPIHKYETVWFSAWKYRTTPEIWVFLYEMLARAARSGGVWTAVPRAVRVYVFKHGLWAIIPQLFVLAITIWGFGIFVVVIAILGVIGFLKLYSVYRWVRKLPPKMFSLPQHSEKLGLQAVIGDDVVALLKGWIPRRSRIDTSVAGAARVLFWRTLYAGALAAVVLALDGTLETKHEFLDSLYPDKGVHNLIVSLATAAGLLLPIWAICGGGKTERIALIIDDLDRCDPMTMLEVIESLKLLLEDPAVSSRVQVVMLIEEEALHHAIAERYKHYEEALPHEPQKSAVPQQRSTRLKRAILESVEKLFVAHLRLPPLGEHQLTEVMNKYVEQHGLLQRMTEQQRTEAKQRRAAEESASQAAAPQDADGGARDAPSQRSAVGSPTGSTRPESSLAAVAQPNLLDALFTAEERAALSDAVAQLVAHGKGPALGPRALRTFVTRYQLAKLLLSVRNRHCAAKELVEHLVKGEVPASADAHVIAVVAEVS